MSDRDLQAEREQLVTAIEALALQQEVRHLRAVYEWGQSEAFGFTGDAPGRATQPGNEAVGRPLGTAYARVRDQLEGRQVPLYETQWDLARVRQQCRNLATFSEVYLGALQAKRCYEVGGEWAYTIEALTETPNDRLIAAAQHIVDRVLEDNDFVGDLDGELHDQQITDGDVLVAAYPERNGRCRLDVKTADQIVEPNTVSKEKLNSWLGTPGARWDFGTHARYDARLSTHDYARPCGWFVVHDDSGTRWDYFPRLPQPNGPIDDLRHATLLKGNTNRRAARGWSDFATLVPKLELFHKLWQGLTVGATIQSHIAYILEGAEGTGRTAAAGAPIKSPLQQYIEQAAAARESAGESQYLGPGTIVKTSPGQKYMAAPMGSPNSAIFIQVAQFTLRLIGVRWSMPEYMISGDASNANFSSTVQATSPFTKARQASQHQLRQKFHRIVWKAVHAAYLDGQFTGIVATWADLCRQVCLTVTPPEITTRNKVEEVQANETLHRNGILDKQTWAAMAGLDPEKVDHAVPAGGGPVAALPMGPVQAIEAQHRAWEGYP